MNTDYVETGISALASVHKSHPGAWFFGHTGAAILSGCFLLDEIPLETEVRSAVHLCIRDFAGKNPLDTGILVSKNHVQGSLDPLVSQLDKCVSSLCADGHGVIFAALALKAFHACPHLISDDRVAGICALMDATFADSPQRYYGISNYKDERIRFDDIEDFKTPLDAALYSLWQHSDIYPDRTIEGKHYFFAGDQLHLITHAHALLELGRLGYSELATKGLQSFRKQVHLTRNTRIPTDSVPAKAVRTPDPMQLEFWLDRKADSHQIKLAYSLLSILNFVDKETRNEALHRIAPYWHLMS